MSAAAFALQLALALLFGAAIGAERQWRQRTAGLRTNALVSSGAAMFVLGGRLMGAPTDNVLRVAVGATGSTLPRGKRAPQSSGPERIPSAFRSHSQESIDERPKKEQRHHHDSGSTPASVPQIRRGPGDPRQFVAMSRTAAEPRPAVAGEAISTDILHFSVRVLAMQASMSC
jgi:hypothetical protein